MQEIKDLNFCSRDCEVGTLEVLKMQQKHVEVARLTYSKNISRCQQIHGNISLSDIASQRENGTENDQEDLLNSTLNEGFNATALSHCITHNTDKVDRRFFGYYNNQKMKLMGKYFFD